MSYVEVKTLIKSKINDSVNFLPSTISGHGLFANSDLEMNTLIHVTHVHRDLLENTGCENTWINLTPNNLYNHSENANCNIVTEGLTKGLVTIRKIKKGEELLVDYTKDKILEQPEGCWKQ